MTTENAIYQYNDLPSLMLYQFLMDEDYDAPKLSKLSARDISRIIELAWQDNTSLNAVQTQFGLNEAEVKKLMKANIKMSSYKVWRNRIEHNNTRHVKTRFEAIHRFKCNLQMAFLFNKITKRMRPEF